MINILNFKDFPCRLFQGGLLLWLVDRLPPTPSVSTHTEKNLPFCFLCNLHSPISCCACSFWPFLFSFSWFSSNLWISFHTDKGENLFLQQFCGGPLQQVYPCRSGPWSSLTAVFSEFHSLRGSTDRGSSQLRQASLMPIWVVPLLCNSPLTTTNIFKNWLYNLFMLPS